MAKSRTLIPLASIIVLSLTAAVTSTFAWFNANRDVTVLGAPISIINPKGRLSVEAFEGAGTTIEQGNDVAVNIKHHGNFRDGSLDLATKKAYTSNLDVDGNLTTGQKYREVKDNGLTGENGGYIDSATNCHIVQNYNLKFTFGDKDTEYGTYGLFFDGEQFNKENVLDGSGITFGDALNDVDAHVARGLRIAMVSDASGQENKESKTLIYGPSAYTSLKRDKGVISYVSGLNQTSDYNVTPITGQLAEKLRMPEGSYTKVGEGKNHLGDFVINEQHKESDYLNVKVWFWFEGCDTYNIAPKVLTDVAFNIRLNFNVMPCKDPSLNQGK